MHIPIKSMLVSSTIFFSPYTCGKYTVSFGVVFFGDVFSIFPPIFLIHVSYRENIMVIEICS